MTTNAIREPSTRLSEEALRARTPADGVELHGAIVTSSHFLSSRINDRRTYEGRRERARFVRSGARHPRRVGEISICR